MLLTLFSKTFKDNKSLYKGILIGILKLSKEDFNTDFNNYIEHTVEQDKIYNKYFGFTE